MCQFTLVSLVLARVGTVPFKIKLYFHAKTTKGFEESEKEQLLQSPLIYFNKFQKNKNLLLITLVTTKFLLKIMKRSCSKIRKSSRLLFICLLLGCRTVLCEGQPAVPYEGLSWRTKGKKLLRTLIWNGCTCYYNVNIYLHQLFHKIFKIQIIPTHLLHWQPLLVHVSDISFPALSSLLSAIVFYFSAANFLISPLVFCFCLTGLHFLFLVCCCQT